MSLHAVAGHLLREAHAVLLPATDEAALSDGLRDFLGAGGRSVLLGETREEYVGRRMTDERIARESAGQVSGVAAEAAELAGAPVLIAVDFELAGIQRLPALVPPLPTRAELPTITDDALFDACRATALGLRDLGVTTVLSPIADVLDAPNPWLDDRHLGPDPAHVTRAVTIYIRAFEAAGVATTVKHFPGHRGLTTDPAVDAVAHVSGNRDVADADLDVFRDALAAGASCVMTGPGTVEAFDPARPALLSPAVVAVLRDDLAFDGLVISDGLEDAAVLAGIDASAAAAADRTPLEQAAVEALLAGNDLLLVGAANDLTALATTVARAVTQGELSAGRLADAAGRVSRLTPRPHG